MVEWAQIFSVTAAGDDTLVRMTRKRSLRHLEPLDEVEARIPSPPFFRIHRSYIVNLDRVFELRVRQGGEHEVKLDPPVNAVLPVSRRRYRDLRELLGL